MTGADRVLVCGGRNFTDRRMFDTAMLNLYRRGYVGLIGVVIHGAASGADTLAQKWCKRMRVPEIACPADWGTFGRGAGYIRNKEMLIHHKPTLVVAFPGGPGTFNMADIARKAGVPVLLGLDLSRD
jgi:hypothetical protein